MKNERKSPCLPAATQWEGHCQSNQCNLGASLSTHLRTAKFIMGSNLLGVGVSPCLSVWMSLSLCQSVCLPVHLCESRHGASVRASSPTADELLQRLAGPC